MKFLDPLTLRTKRGELKAATAFPFGMTLAHKGDEAKVYFVNSRDRTSTQEIQGSADVHIMMQYEGVTFFADIWHRQELGSHSMYPVVFIPDVGIPGRDMPTVFTLSTTPGATSEFQLTTRTKEGTPMMYATDPVWLVLTHDANLSAVFSASPYIEVPCNYRGIDRVQHRQLRENSLRKSLYRTGLIGRSIFSRSGRS